MFLIVVLLVVISKTVVFEVYQVVSISMFPSLKPGDYLFVNKFLLRLSTPRFFPFTNYRIPSISMAGLQSIQRGDIVAFYAPAYSSRVRKNSDETLVKRCIGLPGDDIQYHHAGLFVNSRKDTFGNYPYNGPPDSIVISIHIPKVGDTLRVHSNMDRMLVNIIEDEGHTVQMRSNGTVFIDNKLATKYFVTRDYYFMLGDNRLHSIDSRNWGGVSEEHIIGGVYNINWLFRDNSN